MTTPTPDPAPRPSVPVLVVAHTESVLNHALAHFVALLGVAGFGYLTYLEVTSAQPSNVRLALMSAPLCVCVAMLTTDQLIDVLTRVAPFIQSWRKSDDRR